MSPPNHVQESVAHMEALLSENISNRNRQMVEVALTALTPIVASLPSPCKDNPIARWASSGNILLPGDVNDLFHSLTCQTNPTELPPTSELFWYPFVICDVTRPQCSKTLRCQNTFLFGCIWSPLHVSASFPILLHRIKSGFGLIGWLGGFFPLRVN